MFSTSSMVIPSTPAEPPFLLTSTHARHNISGRNKRSYSAWNLRSLLFLAARYSLRWSSRDFSIWCSWPFGMHSHLPFRWALLKQRHFSKQSFVVFAIIDTFASSDFSYGFLLDFTFPCLYRQLQHCGLLTIWDLSCFIACFHSIPFPLHRRVLRWCIPVSSHLPRPSLDIQSSALSFSLAGTLTMLQNSLYVTDYCFAHLSQVDTALRHI